MDRDERLDYLTNRMLDLGYSKSDLMQTVTDYLKTAEPQDLNAVIRSFEKKWEFVLKYARKVS